MGGNPCCRRSACPCVGNTNSCWGSYCDGTVIRGSTSRICRWCPWVMAGGVGLLAIVALAVFVQPFAAVTVTV
ncbi:MAG: hypothetical protein IPL33_18860 [Sphingobacteriales bacterium]|nr:hypothetical protein [Sphingobacteriales bacterium]